MAFTVARQKELLNAQSAIARKVFEVVPIQDAWTNQAIASALQQQTRSSIQFRTLEGCMRALREAGLVTEPKSGHYQQVMPRESYKAMKTEPEIELVSAPTSAVEMLRELAARARSLSLDIAAAADVVGEELANNNEGLRKLQQLQSILKSMS